MSRRAARRVASRLPMFKCRAARKASSRPPKLARTKPGFEIKNATVWPLQISLNHVGPLYWDIVQPGESFVQDTGAVWFTVNAAIYSDPSQKIKLGDAIKPIAIVTGTVLFAAATGGAGAIAAGATGASASAAATTVSTALMAAGVPSTTAVYAGGAIVSGGSAAARIALEAVFQEENVEVSQKGCYAGAPWPRKTKRARYEIVGGPMVKKSTVDGKKVAELEGSPMRLIEI